ncbi:hypothetical protein PVAP13_3NG076903 [Panicum virgatum]|uniref:Uncharacterized protein n=1 Tax=Panicum virgatum TaxID=38727 RepID=A0A8T0U9A6_PANVG|nr:hypothetical protein PVAP13_3NG076903 [Panicum virgatum]KAG2619390.1 hypothetical protein PVAP13_3NG076903 [Panicum virgatum]KAG2619391.1 hypothetical protein PVAP13_3NG076903 [Panicum virgatum]
MHGGYGFRRRRRSWLLLLLSGSKEENGIPPPAAAPGCRCSRDSTESNEIPPPSRLRRSRKPVRRRRVKSPAAHLRAKIRPPLESRAWVHPSSEGYFFLKESVQVLK